MKPNDALLTTGGAQHLAVEGVRHGRAFAGSDWVADEVPVALEFNGISHAVMLATPLDLEDFALGFSLSEGLLASRDELYGVDEEPSVDGITLKLEVSSAAFARLKDRRRSMAGRTGCGLCGAESLAQVTRPLPALPLPSRSPAGCGRVLRLQRAAVARAMIEMKAMQTLQHATGAVHAAAWCTADGEVALLREDVGRHNALDKLIGALARGRPVGLIDHERGFFAVTSRASFEMVQKTAVAGVPLLAAVSAPTTLAVRTAESAGLTLIGFARDHDLVVYSHPERLAPITAD
ncbi:MAG: formate dehydrogenase accessory sulfurtransferase FdhD [Burkholderiaceae bacterium]|nr:formate dehydrogenase accessory sulfurtransferase FdhD [Burkholderiaceae bacterium]